MKVDKDPNGSGFLSMRDRLAPKSHFANIIEWESSFEKIRLDVFMASEVIETYSSLLTRHTRCQS